MGKDDKEVENLESKIVKSVPRWSLAFSGVILSTCLSLNLSGLNLTQPLNNYLLMLAKQAENKPLPKELKAKELAKRLTVIESKVSTMKTISDLRLTHLESIVLDRPQFPRTGG